LRRLFAEGKVEPDSPVRRAQRHSSSSQWTTRNARDPTRLAQARLRFYDRDSLSSRLLYRAFAMNHRRSFHAKTAPRGSVGAGAVNGLPTASRRSISSLRMNRPAAAGGLIKPFGAAH
jgi:hypothetical protein